MREIVLYCSILITLAFSIFLNLQDSKEIVRLKKGLTSMEELPFLKKIVETTNFQHFFEGKKVDINQTGIVYPILCIFYSSSMCESCIEASLDDLDFISGSINPEKIVVITDYTDKRDLLIIKNILKKNKIKTLKISEVYLDDSFFNLMTANIPLLFVVDSDKVVKAPSMHIKEIPLYNKKYYETINEMFFNQ